MKLNQTYFSFSHFDYLYKYIQKSVVIYELNGTKKQVVEVRSS